MIERDDDKINGEYKSCSKYGQRGKFEYTVLFQGKFVVVGIDNEGETFPKSDSTIIVH